MPADAPVPIIDGHVDVVSALLRSGPEAPDAFFAGKVDGHVDLPRLRRGKVAAAFCACFVPDDDVRAGRAFAETVRLVGLLRRLVAMGRGQVALVLDAANLRRCLQQNTFGAVLHFEGAEPIDPDLAALRVFYALGLRSLGLTWSRPNAFAQGVGPQDTGQGLTAPGRRLVTACNHLGIAIDVSHLNDAGFWDVLATSTRPVVASHSNCRAISPHPRNLADEQIRALAAAGGLVGITFAVRFLRPDMAGETDVSLDTIVDHVCHAAEVGGIEHVALGSDFDGTLVPDGIADAAGV